MEVLQSVLSILKESFKILGGIGGLAGIAACAKILLDIRDRNQKEKKERVKPIIDFDKATSLEKVYGKLDAKITEKFEPTKLAYRQKINYCYSNKDLISQKEAEEMLEKAAPEFAELVCQTLIYHNARISVDMSSLFEEIKNLTSEKLKELMMVQAVSFLEKAADRDIFNPDSQQKNEERLKEFLSKIDTTYSNLTSALLRLLEKRVQSTSRGSHKYKNSDNFEPGREKMEQL